MINKGYQRIFVMVDVTTHSKNQRRKKGRENKRYNTDTEFLPHIYVSHYNTTIYSRIACS